MAPNHQPTNFVKQASIAIVLLACLLLIIYSNTFQASWHLDDYDRIVHNSRLHLTNLQPQSIWQTFFSSIDNGYHKPDQLYRPVPCLTFGLNWYFGKDGVAGYHVVNLLIHYLTAVFLYLTVLNLFKTPNLKDRCAGSEHFIAALTAILWAINPLQIQTVTYIVQRMAQLGTLFYLLGIYFYLKARTVRHKPKQLLFYIGCIVSYPLAIGSKEFAVVFPAALFLIETVFFQDLSLSKTKRTYLSIFAGIGVIVILGVVVAILNKNALSIFNRYEIRPFTLAQRLMTEPRVLVFYLSQIFYPIPSRFSITHDIVVSTSLVSPWSTIAAILAILAGIGYALRAMQKRPFISFAILFFFLNHVVESSILPLALVFEHRNYLPSLFLFLPVAAGIKWVLDYYAEKKRGMYLACTCFITVLLMAVGMGTYARNMTWATEKSLWEDAMTKAPQSARPRGNLGVYYENTGRIDLALHFYKQALVLKDSKPKKSKVLAFRSIAGIYVRKGEYARAISYLQKALDIDPDNEPARYKLALAFYYTGNGDAASEQIDLLLAKPVHRPNYLKLKGFTLTRAQKYKAALTYFKKALQLAPDDKSLVDAIGVTMSRLGYYDRSQWFLKRALQISSNNMATLFYLIETRLIAGDSAGVERYLDKLFNAHSIKAIASMAKETAAEDLTMGFSTQSVPAVISKRIRQITGEITARAKRSK
jgi:Tfp pilus assembly protein PilF